MKPQIGIQFVRNRWLETSFMVKANRKPLTLYLNPECVVFTAEALEARRQAKQVKS
jgi:hypothetical protein